MELRQVNFKEIPNRSKIKEFIHTIMNVFYPNYFEEVKDPLQEENKVYELFKEIASKDEKDLEYFKTQLEYVRKTLLKDLEWFYESDPASKSFDEIILCYPGFYAIFVYRISHILYEMNIKLTSRILSEIAHNKTGIDIHAGAKISDYFFIDHGTGVVIGETTVIGDHVKIYQGVTLGALSIPNAETLRDKKRHPTIGSYVTIYAGASILGGETTIGNNVIIGSNVFITSSIPDNVKVLNPKPNLVIK